MFHIRCVVDPNPHAFKLTSTPHAVKLGPQILPSKPLGRILPTLVILQKSNSPVECEYCWTPASPKKVKMWFGTRPYIVTNMCIKKPTPKNQFDRHHLISCSFQIVYPSNCGFLGVQEHQESIAIITSCNGQRMGWLNAAKPR